MIEEVIEFEDVVMPQAENSGMPELSEEEKAYMEEQQEQIRLYNERFSKLVDILVEMIRTKEVHPYIREDMNGYFVGKFRIREVGVNQATGEETVLITMEGRKTKQIHVAYSGSATSPDYLRLFTAVTTSIVEQSDAAIERFIARKQ